MGGKLVLLPLFFWFLFGGLCVSLEVRLRLLFAGPWADYVGEVAWGLGAVEASGGRVFPHQLLYKPHTLVYDVHTDTERGYRWPPSPQPTPPPARAEPSTPSATGAAWAPSAPQK